MKSFKERMNDHDRQFRRMQKFTFWFFGVIAFLIIILTILQGIALFKLLESPELIGEWLNGLMSGIKGEQ